MIKKYFDWLFNRNEINATCQRIEEKINKTTESLEQLDDLLKAYVLYKKTGPKAKDLVENFMAEVKAN